MLNRPKRNTKQPYSDDVVESQYAEECVVCGHPTFFTIDPFDKGRYVRLCCYNCYDEYRHQCKMRIK